MPGLRRPLGYAATVLRDRPIGLWRLNLAGRALGQESSGHPGLYTPVVNGTVTPARQSALVNEPEGGALFDGSTGYIDLGNSTAIQLTTVSLEALAKTSSNATSTLAVFTKGNAWGLFMDTQQWRVYDWGVAHAWVIQDTVDNPSDGRWHHLALSVRSGVSNGSTLYVDGVARGSATVTVGDQTISLQIGANTAIQQWPGSLQNVALYDYALSAAQVKAHNDARLASAPFLGPAVYSIVSGGGTGAYGAGAYGAGPYGGSGDTTPPTVPTGLSATAISSTRIDLSWVASTDNVAVTGYDVYRGGSLLVTLGTVTSYSDTSCSPSTTYSYTVDAFDAAGNHSTQSSSASAATPATPAAPPAPTSGWWRLARTSDKGVPGGGGSTYASVVAGDLPLSWWRSGESSGLFADQRGRFPGTVNGTVTRNVPGAIQGDPDGAMSFDGLTGYVSYPLFPRPCSIFTPPIASVFNADTQANKSTWASAGGSAVTISAYWDRLQTTQGAALVGAEVTNLNTAISDARALNLEVILECALQYPPAWATTAVAQFKDQSANLYAGSQGSGLQVRDWIFTATGRTQVADYVSKVLAAVTNLNTNVQRMRIGGGYYGELHYPPNGAGPNYQFWGYGAAAQTGTGLASDQATCPLPGYVPFYDAGRTDAKDAQWLNWYWQSLGSFCNWLIDQHRSGGFTGPLHVLHPGGGVRSNQVWTNANYQQSAAAGEHPAFMMDVYKSRSNVNPSCTWLDNQDNVTPPSLDSDKATWRKIRDEAVSRGLASDLWGENTGGNDSTVMAYVFGTSGPFQQASNPYKGVTWLNFASLSPSGPLATLTSDLNAIRNTVTAAGTLSCWAKLPNNPATHGGIMGWRNDTTADFYMLQLLGTNTIECRFRNSAGTNWVFTSGALTPNVWHQLVLVLNGSTMTLYSDTVQVGQVTGISGKMANAGSFQVGRVTGNYFAGSIDEPAFYEFALGA